MVKNSQRLNLIAEVFDYLVGATTTFEEKDRIGASFAYLAGAIAKGTYCLWSENEPMVKLLRGKFGPGHLVWGFIKIETD